MHQVCDECGSAVEPTEDFCGHCGTYLNWDERLRNIEPPAEVEEAEAEPTQDTAPRGLADRVKAAVGLGQVSEGPTTTPAPPPETPSASDSQAVPEDSRTSSEVTAVQPGLPQPGPKPHTRVSPDKRIEPGDLICGNCGSGNKPERRFCRNCGNDLSEAEVAAVPWWRRIFRRTPRPGPVAGTRPAQRKRRRAPRRLLALVVVLGVAAGGFLAIRPYVGGAWEATLDRIRGQEQVASSGVTASSERRGHPATDASDKFGNTYWSPEGDGDRASITFRFDSPFRLVALTVVPGASDTDQEALRAVGRPMELDLAIVSADGDRKTETFVLDNALGPQQKDVATSDVVRVKLTIDGVYEGSRSNSGVAIAMVDFFARK